MEPRFVVDMEPQWAVEKAMAEREPWFYWVKPTTECRAVPAFWDGESWAFAGDRNRYNDDYLAEIGERVEREPPQPEWLREATLHNWRNISGEDLAALSKTNPAAGEDAYRQIFGETILERAARLSGNERRR
jgi:hypothetical protein